MLVILTWQPWINKRSFKDITAHHWKHHSLDSHSGEASIDTALSNLLYTFGSGKYIYSFFFHWSVFHHFSQGWQCWWMLRVHRLVQENIPQWPGHIQHCENHQHFTAGTEHLPLQRHQHRDLLRAPAQHMELGINPARSVHVWRQPAQGVTVPIPSVSRWQQNSNQNICEGHQLEHHQLGPVFVWLSPFLQATRDETQQVNAELAEQDASDLYKVSAVVQKSHFSLCCAAGAALGGLNKPSTGAMAMQGGERGGHGLEHGGSRALADLMSTLSINKCFQKITCDFEGRRRPLGNRGAGFQCGPSKEELQPAESYFSSLRKGEFIFCNVSCMGPDR